MSSFYKKYEHLIKWVSRTLLLSIILLFTTQLLFYALQRKYSDQVSLTVMKILNSVSEEGTPFAVTRLLTDLEEAGLTRCSQLSMIKPNEYSLLDLKVRSSCKGQSEL
ncbi:hypothetical protein GW915_08640, partial [bacterium]|nr:hypothetical protein [bacterium]